MKKLPALLACALVCTFAFISCLYNHHDLSLRFSDTRQYYSMTASYDKDQAKEVESYMDSKLGRPNNMSFINTKIDGKLTLEDHTTLYIKKYPGSIKIELNKDENSDEALDRVKAMCEGFKGVLAK